MIQTLQPRSPRGQKPPGDPTPAGIAADRLSLRAGYWASEPAAGSGSSSSRHHHAVSHGPSSVTRRSRHEPKLRTGRPAGSSQVHQHQSHHSPGKLLEATSGGLLARRTVASSSFAFSTSFHPSSLILGQRAVWLGCTSAACAAKVSWRSLTCPPTAPQPRQPLAPPSPMHRSSGQASGCPIRVGGLLGGWHAGLSHPCCSRHYHPCSAEPL